MRILWITNSPFPEVYEQLNLSAPVTVGWVHSAANALLGQSNDINLAVASFHKVEVLKALELNKITHFIIPTRLKYRVGNDDGSYWQQIKETYKPDVIHIHGSEYFHSYSFVNACGPDKVVLSIQGLVSVIERYYYGNIVWRELMKHTTLRDVARWDTFFTKRKNIQKRGNYEKMLISKIGHVIGRTSWDHDHVWAINPKAAYHFCNETLRPPFYRNRWSLQQCARYSIFVSQAQQPIKGFHQLIKALPIVLKHYPETRVYVAGRNYFSGKGIRLNGYGSYINSLIKRHKLSEHIEFTGFLSEEDICRRYLHAHISVCPSAIENSPNSVGEAQLLGVPCLASYVGGIADMIEHGKNGLLHRFEEAEMLASNICRIFADDGLAVKISENARVCAAKRHDSKRNASDLYQIYLEMIQKTDLYA